MLTLIGFALAVTVQAGPTSWSLHATPAVTIEDDGTPATQFVRIVGVARLSNGGIAVANRGTNDIRIFDSRGQHVTTFGRSGEGPGEFRRLDWVGRSGDTAWFFDSGLQRVTAVLLGAEPKLVGTIRITATGKRESFGVNGRLRDGRFVVTTNVAPTFDGPPGVHRLPGSAGMIARTGDGEVNWLGDFRSAAIFVHNPTGNVNDAATGPIAFPPWLRSATSGEQVWIGDSGGDSLVVVRSRDLSRFTVRIPFARRPPARALIDAAREQEMTGNTTPRGKAFTEAKYSEKYVPRELPSFESLMPGPAGEVWVQEYAGDRSYPTTYVILDANGRARGRLAVPGGSRVRDVGRDYVVLVHADADGVESIRVHGLTRR